MTEEHGSKSLCQWCYRGRHSDDEIFYHARVRGRVRLICQGCYRQLVKCI